MACKAEELRHIPLFALLDNEEIAVLAAQVEIKRFAARQRIYKLGEPGKHAYVMMSGAVRVTTVDQDHQELLVDEPQDGEFFCLPLCWRILLTKQLHLHWKRRLALR